MSKYFLGVDVSTTASKALIIDVDGNVLVTKGNSHELSTPRPLWSEQDPENWWQAASKSIREVLQQIPAEQIAAIGLTGQMHGLTSLDRDGKPVRPAILWNDQRSTAQCAAITARVGEKHLYQHIGSILLAGFTAPKIMWVRENEPDVYQRIAHVLLPKDYIRYRLSGAFVADVADASGFGLMDIGKRDWSDEMLAAFDIPHSWLPELCESPEVCAYVSEEGAAATGLKVGTPIVGGAGDQPASGVGNGIVVKNQTSLTIGTSGVAYAASDRYAPEPDGRLNQEIEYSCPAASIMFFYKNTHSPVKHPHIIHAAFTGTLSFKMYDTGAGKIIVLIPGLLYTVTKINVFPVHEKGLIKAAYLFQHFSPDHHESTGQYIHFVVFVFIQVAEVITGKCAGTGK